MVLVNGLTHTILSLAYTEYVPGLITSILLWIPLGVATLVGLRRTMREARYWLCVALGVGIELADQSSLVTTTAGPGLFRTSFNEAADLARSERGSD